MWCEIILLQTEVVVGVSGAVSYVMKWEMRLRVLFLGTVMIGSPERNRPIIKQMQVFVKYHVFVSSVFYWEKQINAKIHAFMYI